jgi:phosphinothricin acetyltransferase
MGSERADDRGAPGGTAAGVRAAAPGDAAAIAAIWTQGIAERVATFETRPKSPEQIDPLIAGGGLILIAERDGSVIGFAKAGPYDDASHYYSGVGEATLYVDPGFRRLGIGRSLLEALAVEAGRRGLYKLTGKIFSSNEASLALFLDCGFREVGIHRRHGRLDGEWKDVVVVERLVGEATAD